MIEVFDGLNIGVWSIVKIAYLFAILLYVIFAVVVLRQVALMAETLEVDFDKYIKLAARVHLFVSVGVFIFAFFYL